MSRAMVVFAPEERSMKCHRATSTWLRALALGVLTLVVAKAEAQGPIKIGMIAPLSGTCVPGR